MKGLKYFVISGLLTLSAFAAVTYSSCTKDACNGVTCLNGGTCLGGICTCKDEGLGGNNCEIEFRKVFAGTYQGFAHNTGHNDTAVFKLESTGDSSNFKTMNVTWLESKVTPVSFMVELNNPTSEGATFAIPKTVVGNKTYIGTGAITGKTATINLSETIVSPTDTTHNSLSFPNLIKAN